MRKAELGGSLLCRTRLNPRLLQRHYNTLAIHILSPINLMIIHNSIKMAKKTKKT